MISTRLERRESREAAAASGMCVDCRVRARGMNQDGTLGRRCMECRKRTVQRRATHTQASEAYEFEYPTWIDSREYAVFCVAVLTAIREIGRASIGDIKRVMGEKCFDRWLADALGTLEAAGEVTPRLSGSLTRWEVG